MKYLIFPEGKYLQDLKIRDINFINYFILVPIVLSLYYHCKKKGAFLYLNRKKNYPVV